MIEKILEDGKKIVLVVVPAETVLLGLAGGGDSHGEGGQGLGLHQYRQNGNLLLTNLESVIVCTGIRHTAKSKKVLKSLLWKCRGRMISHYNVTFILHVVSMIVRPRPHLTTAASHSNTARSLHSKTHFKMITEGRRNFVISTTPD